MSHAIALPCPTEANADRWVGLDPFEFAARGFLAAYKARTLEAYTGDLKNYFGWCTDHQLPPLQALRPHLELYIRWMEQVPYSSATIGRRFNTVALFYGYATDEEIIARNPAAKVKRPRVDKDGQRRTYLTPLEHGLFIVAAEKFGPAALALATLLGMRGLRISEACSLNVEDVTQIGGYDHITFIGKGGGSATVPLPIPCARAVRAAIGDRTSGPVLLNLRCRRMDRGCAQRLIDKITAAAGVNSDISPHSLRRSFVTTQLAMGVPLRDVQLSVRHRSPNTTVIYDRRSSNPDSDTAHRLAGHLAGMGG